MQMMPATTFVLILSRTRNICMVPVLSVLAQIVELPLVPDFAQADQVCLCSMLVLWLWPCMWFFMSVMVTPVSRRSSR